MKGTVACGRSFLFVPADRPDRLPKALATTAHLVVADLEDAVAADYKSAARQALLGAGLALDAGQRARLMVRINGAETRWFDDDLLLAQTLCAGGIAGVMLPKAEAALPLGLLAQSCPGVALVPMIESAAGLHALNALAAVPAVARFAFGHLDFQLDLQMECDADESELQPARFAIAAASARTGISSPIDGVTVDIGDKQRLRSDCTRSRRSGFGAKLCIHPAQVSIVNEVLVATEQQRAWARGVLREAAIHHGNAFQFDGKMVDAPVLRRAESYLAD